MPFCKLATNCGPSAVVRIRRHVSYALYCPCLIRLKRAEPSRGCLTRSLPFLPSLSPVRTLGSDEIGSSGGSSSRRWRRFGPGAGGGGEGDRFPQELRIYWSPWSWLEEDDRLPCNRRAVWEFVGHGWQQGQVIPKLPQNLPLI
jgi:hypothetical protein